jgi:hypothetical protein
VCRSMERLGHRMRFGQCAARKRPPQDTARLRRAPSPKPVSQARPTTSSRRRPAWWAAAE